MSIAAVVLAADPGEGFANLKYATPIRGSAMLDRVVADARSWPVDEVIVVLGADAEAVEDACDLSDVSVVVDPEWEEGLAAPLRAVLDLLSRDRGVEACVIARGDQPGISAEVVERLVERHRSTGAPAVAPKYRYAIGWPVVVDRDLWDVFLRLEGSIEVHDALVAHVGAIDEVWFDQLAPRAFASAADLPTAGR